MNDSNELERLLTDAPRPRVPDHLLARLQADINLPSARRQAEENERAFRLGKLIPILSIAAAAAVLAVSLILFFPASTAYSFQKTIESLREVSAMHVIYKFRDGPLQPLPESAIGDGRTTWHPANDFSKVEMITAIENGRRLEIIRSSDREVIRNGQLGLTIDSATGERKFFLAASEDWTGFENPAAWFSELQQDFEENEVEYEVSERPDIDGNLKIVVRQRTFDVPHQTVEEQFIIWVNAKTNLPVRAKIVSSAFPEYGEQVVMAEWEILKFGDIDRTIFDIEPTDAELEYWGLQREDLQDLPPSATSIEINGEAGLQVVGTIRDDNGSREISGTLPLTLMEAPQGRMTISLHAEDEKVHRLEAVIGDWDLAAMGEFIIISLHEDGSERGIASMPMAAAPDYSTASPK